MPVTWTKDLAVGNSEIDAQHQELFAALDGLVCAIQAGRGPEEVARMLKFLEEYTAFHFAAEERLMEEMNYPGLEGQRLEHGTFLRDLAAWKVRYQAGGTTATQDLAFDLEHRLGAWLRTHIAETDHDLRPFLAGRGRLTNHNHKPR